MWEERIGEYLDRQRKALAWRELSLSDAVSFSHNDYLGLAEHPELRLRALDSLKSAANGASGSRLLGGNSSALEALEARIAQFFESPCALYFPSGYQANLSAAATLAGLSDGVVSDEQSHASLIDGIRLSKKPKQVVPHNQWKSLSTPQCPLFVAESLYSMDGDFVDWEGLKTAVKASHGFLLLDEAHAAGVFDPTGRGFTASDRDWEKMAVVVTFGKAFGVAGGAVLSSPSVKALLINAARPFIYSTAPLPAQAAYVVAALEVMEAEGRARRSQLWERSAWVRKQLQNAGVPVLGAEKDRFSPIVAVPIAGNDRALRFSQTMRNLGWDLRAIRHPTVAKGSERIRVSVNLRATWEQTEKMVQELVEQWKVFS
jgi:8-amino-7-oxononanoate synthase